MRNKSKQALLLLLLLLSATLTEIIILGTQHDLQEQQRKQQVVALIQLPDLAIGLEGTWLRHRSLASVFSIFPDDGTLMEHYKSAFVIQPVVSQ